MSIIKEFKEFALKGNFLDLAVGVILGAASGDVVKALVDKIIMPPIGLALGKVKFDDLKVVLQPAVMGPDGKEATKEVAILWGSAVQTVISFFLISLVVFLIVRSYNRFRAKAPPAEAPAQEKLLTEIRDLLKDGAKAK